MEIALIAFSIVLQTGAVVQAVRLALKQRRTGWVFLALANALMLARRSFSAVAVFAHERPVDVVAEGIALLISLLMAVGLTLLLAWLKEGVGEEASEESIKSGARVRLKEQAMLLALASLFGCAGLSYFTYDASRTAVTNRLLKGSLDLAHMLGTAVRSAPDRAAAMGELQRLWREAPSQYADNYLCVIRADGILELNTRQPEKTGMYVGATKIPGDKAAPRTVAELAASHRSWAGRNLSAEGNPQLAAYAYCPSLDALVVVHLPARSVDAEIHAAALPWAGGIAVIFLIVLPLSFGLLFHVGSASERDAFHALRRQLESERRYTMLIENITDHAIFLLDAEGRVSTWNPGAEIVRGWTEAEIRGRPLSTFYTPEAVAAGQPEKDLQVAAANGSMASEGWRLRQDGSRFWASVTISSGRDGDRETSGYLVVTRDITESKAAEAAVAQREAILHRVLDTNENIIFIKDRESRILMANEALARQYGLKVTEIVGRRQDELHRERGGDPEEIRKWLAEGRAVLDSGYMLECIETGRNHEGRVGTYRSRKYPIEFSPGQPAVLVVSEDITSLVEANDTLRASEANYRALFESAADGIFISDSEDRYLDVNERGCKMLGYKREELLGLTINDVVLGDETVRLGPELARLAVGSVAHSEWQCRRKDGSVFPCEISATVLPDGRRLTIRRDITERKKLEEQFLRAQRMESIGTLAGGIAHDLNNVLAPILMSIELLKMKNNDPDSDELLEVVRASAQHGADMVRQVLHFARGVEGRRMEVQIPLVIQAVAKIAHDTFPKLIEFRSAVAPGLWGVLGDPTQIQQVLLNFCVNARDAMPAGGRLRVSAENISLDAHYAGMNLEARPGPHVVIKVEDSGMGMTREVIPNIFDPFFTTKDVGKGTGLGLSTSLAIVKSHDGFIRVYSEVGKGTKFEIYLPALTAPASIPVVEAVAEIPRGNGELILVVDDEARMRAVAQRTLEAFGYRVVIASDGAEAVTVFAERGLEIALVLTDMTMPVMDGPATIHVMQRMHPEVPIIATSGLSDSGQVAFATVAGVSQFLPKPYTAETLLRAVHEVLAKSRRR